MRAERDVRGGGAEVPAAERQQQLHVQPEALGWVEHTAEGWQGAYPHRLDVPDRASEHQPGAG